MTDAVSGGAPAHPSWCCDQPERDPHFGATGSRVAVRDKTLPDAWACVIYRSV